MCDQTVVRSLLLRLTLILAFLVVLPPVIQWYVRLQEKYNWRVWSSEGMVGVGDMRGKPQGERYLPDVPCVHHFSASGMVRAWVSYRI